MEPERFLEAEDAVEALVVQLRPLKEQLERHVVERQSLEDLRQQLTSFVKEVESIVPLMGAAVSAIDKTSLADFQQSLLQLKKEVSGQIDRISEGAATLSRTREDVSQSLDRLGEGTIRGLNDVQLVVKDNVNELSNSIAIGLSSLRSDGKDLGKVLAVLQVQGEAMAKRTFLRFWLVFAALAMQTVAISIIGFRLLSK